MAGDWIKMRSNLWDDPRIARLCDMTESSESAVIGALYWLWASADQHSEDGIMNGLTLRSIDRKVSIQGFGSALLAIGWIADHPEGVRIVRFEEHNGKSAKRRCSESIRKMSARDADKTGTESGNGADKDRTDGRQDTDKPRTESSKGAHLEKEKEKESKPKSRDATATRLPADWKPDDVGIAFCKAERPDLNAESVADRFRDYWTAQPGAKGRKTDWPATWRNWVRNENAQKVAAQKQISDSPKPGDKAIINGAELTYYAGLGFAL